MDRLARICLGTAQFGLDYGISNTHGKISTDEVGRILASAHKNGVEWLDTAADYGTCEDALSEHADLLRQFKVTTKSIKYDNSEYADFGSVRSASMAMLQRSCEKLHRQMADIYYLRSPEVLFEKYGVHVNDFLDELKEQKRIQKTGISVYDVRQIKIILEHFTPDVIQVPCNFLDQRLIDNGTFQELKDRGIEIHARSVFMQGLIFMQADNTPEYFLPLRDHLNFIQSHLEERGISPLQAALDFIMSQDMIDRIIVGVSSYAEWLEILSVLRQPAQIVMNWDDFKITDERFLNPAKWRT